MRRTGRRKRREKRDVVVKWILTYSLPVIPRSLYAKMNRLIRTSSPPYPFLLPLSPSSALPLLYPSLPLSFIPQSWANDNISYGHKRPWCSSYVDSLPACCQSDCINQRGAGGERKDRGGEEEGEQRKWEVWGRRMEEWRGMADRGEKEAREGRGAYCSVDSGLDCRNRNTDVVRWYSDWPQRSWVFSIQIFK